MNKRIDKKKQKRQSDITITDNAATCTASNATAIAAAAIEPAANSSFKTAQDQVDFFIQYQNQEYLEKDIIEKIKEKCKSQGTEIKTGEKLSVYLKPEEKKAYFTCSGVNGYVEV